MSDVAELLEQGLQLENEEQVEEAVGIYQQVIDSDPSNSLGYLYKGLARVRDSEYELALTDLEKAGELDPTLGEIDPESDLGKRIDWAIKVFEWETTVEPNSATVHLQLARALKALGKLDRAQLSLHMVIQLHPDNWDASYLLAKIAMLQGQYESAVKELQQLVRGRSNEPNLQYELGLAYDKMGSAAPAQRHLEKACALDPGVAEYRLALADLALRQGRYPNAVQGFESTLKLSPGNYEALIGLARCHRAQFQFDQALEAYEKALEARPGDPELETELAEVYVQVGQPDRALATLVRQAEADPENREAWEKVARAAEGGGNLSRALDAYQRVLALNPLDPATWAQLGEVQVRGQQFEDALHSLSRAAELDPAEPRYALMALEILRRGGRHDQARDLLLRAASQHSGSFDLQVQAGLLMLESGNYDGAWRALSAAVRLRPDQAQAQWGLGQVFLRQLKLDEAFACLRAALKLEPRHPGTLLSMAQVCRLRGDLEMAQDFLDQAMELQPGALPLLEETGYLAVAQGQAAAVRAVVTRLVDALPDPNRLWPTLENWARGLSSTDPLAPFAQRYPGYPPMEGLVAELSAPPIVEEAMVVEEALESGEELVSVEEALESGEELVSVEEVLESGEEIVEVLEPGEEIVEVLESGEVLEPGEEIVEVEEVLEPGEELEAVLEPGEEIVEVEEVLESGEEIEAVLEPGEEIVEVEEVLESGEVIVEAQEVAEAPARLDFSPFPTWVAEEPAPAEPPPAEEAYSPFPSWPSEPPAPSAGLIAPTPELELPVLAPSEEETTAEETPAVEPAPAGVEEPVAAEEPAPTEEPAPEPAAEPTPEPVAAEEPSAEPLPDSPGPVEQLGPRHKIGRPGEKAMELPRSHAQTQQDQMATLRELYRLEKMASEAGLWLGMEHSLAALDLARNWLTMAPQSLPVREFFLSHSLDLAGALEEAAATEEAVYVLDSCLDLIDEPTLRLKLAALCGIQSRQMAHEGSLQEAVRLAQRRVELLPELPESSQLRDEFLLAWSQTSPIGAELRAFERANKRAGLGLVVATRVRPTEEEAPPLPAGDPEELRGLLLENPEDRSLHLQLEEVLHGEERVAYYRELVNQKSDSMRLLAGLARAYAATGQFQLAVVQFQKALKQGTDREISLELASTYDRLGKPKLGDKIRAALS